MTAENTARLVGILCDLRARPRRADGAAYSDDEIAALPFEKIDLDSLTFLEVMYRVEEEFDVVFGDVAVREFANLADVAARIGEMRVSG